MDRMNLAIDRMVLTGLPVSPHRAERIRHLVEMELQRQLSVIELPDRLASHEISRLSVPPMQLTGQLNDSHMANSLAQSIVQALQSAGHQKE